MYERLTIVKSSLPLKKWDAIFEGKEGRRKKVPFGAKHDNGIPYTDYTLGASDSQREAYLSRHRGEDWNDYTSAGSLSRWILWGNSHSIRRNIEAFKNRFNLK